jgi:hypothetical protein
MEIFDLVSFSNYEVTERGPYLGQTRDMVEVLVGQDV